MTPLLQCINDEALDLLKIMMLDVRNIDNGMVDSRNNVVDVEDDDVDATQIIVRQILETMLQISVASNQRHRQI